MIRYDLIRPLRPDAQYPPTPLSLSFDGINYDLPLPGEVSDALIKCLRTQPTFAKVEPLSNPSGIYTVRAEPEKLTENQTRPRFAESSSQVEFATKNTRLGYVVEYFMLSSTAIDELFKYAMEETKLEKEAGRWVINAFPFLHHSGGIELARIAIQTNLANCKNTLISASSTLESTQKIEQKNRLKFLRLIINQIENNNQSLSN